MRRPGQVIAVDLPSRNSKKARRIFYTQNDDKHAQFGDDLSELLPSLPYEDGTESQSLEMLNPFEW